jgi:two-component system LytT family response regulator
MRLLVVDEEPSACEAVVRVLRERIGVTSLDVASEVTQALALCADHGYDMILVGLHRRDQTAMQLVDRLKEMQEATPIMVAAGFGEHAAAGLEGYSGDYLPKPHSPERLHEAIDHAQQRWNHGSASTVTELVQLLERLTRRAARIAVKTNGRVVFVSPADIISAKAEGNYVMLHQDGKNHLLRHSISALEVRLQPFGFIRIHRSILINTAHVDTMEPLSTGEYLLRMKGGSAFTATRTYKKNLRSLADCWIGMDGGAPAALCQ